MSNRKRNFGAAKYAVCPYYASNDSTRIRCEGVEEGTALHLVFNSTRELMDYKRARCDDIPGYHKCFICGMLDKKNGG